MNKQTCDKCNVFSNSFFSTVGKEDLLDMNEKKICILYKKNQTVFTAGTRPNGIYCLSKGRIKIYKTGSCGKEQIIRFVLPGDFFGLQSLVCDTNYTTTAVAIEDSTICIVGKQDFMNTIDKNPKFTNAIIARLGEMIEIANNKVTSLAQKPVRERLAETLVTLTKVFKAEGHLDHEHSVINLSRQDFANLIGTATETVIRLLSEFKDQNLITVKGRKITVIDVKGLQRIANL